MIVIELAVLVALAALALVAGRRLRRLERRMDLAESTVRGYVELLTLLCDELERRGAEGKGGKNL